MGSLFGGYQEKYSLETILELSERIKAASLV